MKSMKGVKSMKDKALVFMAFMPSTFFMFALLLIVAVVT